ncbi:hypothetical protein CFP56_001443 [Quercus suber]|uniref:Secreted protein n=1 Tax=Quercus suber TaxID=58331 RepID=A0AAW0IMH9_QUESU
MAKLSHGRRSTISVAISLLSAWLKKHGQSSTWHEVSTSRPCLSSSRKAAIAPRLRSAFSGNLAEGCCPCCLSRHTRLFSFFGKVHNVDVVLIFNMKS